MADKGKEPPRPVPIALVICDNVYRESGGKQALVGLFNRITTRRIPAVHARLCVFVSLTEVMPGTTCKIDIVHAETDEPVVSAHGPMPREAGPIAILDMQFKFENLVFKEAGRYYVRVFGNDQIVLQRPFEVVLIEGRNGDDEP
jgi:hypothetical protein